MDNDWALVVGINQYPSAGINHLIGAVHDATRFHEWLLEEKGGAVPAAHATLLTSPPVAHPSPAFSHIWKFFEDLQPGPDARRLYIYLSGHGISPSGQASLRNAALLLANAQPPDKWHNFAGNIWAEGVRSCAMFREVVLVMDCCRDLYNNATIIPYAFGSPVEDSKDCMLIEAYATGWASKAREIPLPPDGTEKGVFTHALLKVLRAGKVSGALLKESVRQHLADLLKDERRPQQTEICPDDNLAKIVFSEGADTPRSSVTIQGLIGQPAIQVLPAGGNLTSVVLDDWSVQGNVWQGTLEPGDYLLDVPGRASQRFQVYAGLERMVSL